MLKDLFNKNSDKNNNNEKILKSIADGYVDIKIYKYNKDRTEKKLVYQDSGDNTVTDWMRQAIVRLLTGYSLSKTGIKEYTTKTTDGDIYFSSSTQPLTTINSEYHDYDNGINLDGCVFAKNQSDSETDYFYNVKGSNNLFNTVKYNSNLVDSDSDYIYPVFPTKVLLGTGKEYTSWENLKAENEVNNSEWYSEMVEWYSSGNTEETAKEWFDETLLKKLYNKYSATVGIQGNYNGSGNLIESVTVNDPETSALEDEAAELSKRYGVVGAVKTAYLPDGSEKQKVYGSSSSDSNDAELMSDVLNPVVSTQGKLVRPKYRGVGAPCFIYFSRTSSNQNLDWGATSSNVSLSADSGNSFLNRITFRVTMPSQTDDEYYPYNGYTLKQIGLFNDCLIDISDGAKRDSVASLMPYGMMLAVKNIASFTKTADQEIIFTWTLTV